MSTMNLNLIKRIQKDLCDKLGLILVPIKVEDINDAAQLRLKENCIVISKRILDDELQSIATIVHELRHEYQILSIYDDDHDEPFRKEWEKGFKDSNTKDIHSSVELDVYSFEKYYIRKKYNLDYKFDNIELDKLTDEYINNKLIKLDI